MPTVEKSVLLRHSAAQMYHLVDRVEDYPAFLPWCGGTEVHQRDGSGVEATIHIHFKGVRQAFTTRNTNHADERIELRLVKGPFSNLEGTWTFTPLRADACKVHFRLHYTFANRLLEAVVGPVFNMIAGSFIESFTRRADQLYGST